VGDYWKVNKLMTRNNKILKKIIKESIDAILVS